MNFKAIEISSDIRQIGVVKNFVLLMLFVLAINLFCGCKKDDAVAPLFDGTSSSEKPVSLEDILPKQAQPKLPTMKIFFGTFHDNNLFRPMDNLDAELATNDLQEMTGMMYRTNIQDTDSMLFVLPYTQRANFWMMHCPESISAAYISPDGTIQEIHHLEKNDTNGVVAATENIRFVLETSDGWFTRHNIPVGTVIRTEKGSLAETFLQGRQ